MEHLTYARAQMGLSLAFHIVFAAAGVALPLVLVVAEVLARRTEDPDYTELAKRMAKGTSILFAVGAVSGTVLSFELGLLWPAFMGTFGDVIGLPFALEGFAFFTEAIFLGVYLYGRGRVSPALHLFSAVAVAISGAASAFFVVLVNAIMNQPEGFAMVAGKPTGIDPIAAMWSAPWRHETVHTLLSCYEATAFALAGIHAALLLKRPDSALFRKAYAVTLVIAGVSAALQPLSGDRAAKAIAVGQPVKLAAAEAHFETGAHAALRVGGFVDEAKGTLSGSIDVPSGLSFLAFGDPGAVVQGLDRVPRDEWPPVGQVHLWFDVMVGSGFVLLGVAALGALLWWRRRSPPVDGRFLWLVALTSPLGLVALEAGWMVTELGRQPWIVRGAMRTADAVTPFPHLGAPFFTFTLVYLALAAAVVWLLWHQLREAHAAAAPEEASP